jgi:hypothetical protein
VFGKSFKTADPHDPHQSAAFMHFEELPILDDGLA